MSSHTFNYSWVIVSAVILANIFFFSFLIKDIKAYVQKTQGNRFEKYQELQDL